MKNFHLFSSLRRAEAPIFISFFIYAISNLADMVARSVFTYSWRIEHEQAMLGAGADYVIKMSFVLRIGRRGIGVGDYGVEFQTF